jgi:glycosyltransferase involved in cell wall biosynthesis
MQKLSIITVNLNNADGLRKTIESLSYQTFKDFEFIVIDGGSIDESVDVIKENENIISYWVSETDNGIYNAMNKGIVHATGEYLLFLNSGDYLCNDNVLHEVLLNGLEEDIVCGNAIFEKSEFHDQRLIIIPDEIVASKLILEFLPHQSTFIKRKLFSEIHLYDESFKVVSDWAFFIEVLLVFKKSFKHINLFVSCCDSSGISSSPENCTLMDTEFHLALKKILPSFYLDYVELRDFRIEKASLRNTLLMKLGSTIWFRILIYARKTLLKFGYYEFKAARKRRKFNKEIEKSDNIKKQQVNKKIYELPLDILQSNHTKDDVIASLTSYGKRVSDSVPYALYTLFTQSRLPNRIILTLDDVHWNSNNIPPILKRLQKSGLEILFTKDLLSYKKLIPVLKLLPDNIILTFDDDFYYDCNIVEKLLDEYSNSDRKSIICHWACIVERSNGKFTKYSNWKEDVYGNIHSIYSPFSGDGTLFPPRIFDDEIFNADVFLKFAPYADDIWFWLMAYRNNVKVVLMDNAKTLNNLNVNNIDLLDEKKSNALYFQNCLHGRNDVQFRDLLNYYEL